MNFGLMKFAPGLFEIHNMKSIVRSNDKHIVRFKGSFYEGVLVSQAATKNELEKLKDFYLKNQEDISSSEKENNISNTEDKPYPAIDYLSRANSDDLPMDRTSFSHEVEPKFLHKANSYYANEGNSGIKVNEFDNNLCDNITQAKQEIIHLKQNKQFNIISSIIIKPAQNIITKSTGTDTEEALKLPLEMYKENQQNLVENQNSSIVQYVTQQENFECNKNNLDNNSLYSHKLESEYENNVNLCSSDSIYPEMLDSDDDIGDPTYQPSESESDKYLVTNSSSDKSTTISETISQNNSNSKLDMTACDDSFLNVEKSQGSSGKQKYNACLYCHKKIIKFARHLEMVHGDEEDVKKFKVLPKQCLERRQIIDVLRKRANYLYNINPSLNNGDLIVCRRPNEKLDRSAKDFKACSKCKGYYSKQSLRVHFAKCSGRSSKHERLVMIQSKQVMSRISSIASSVVRKHLFPALREDNVVRIVRYDKLIILYSNKMCEKYRHYRHHDMIRARIRLLGRFLITIKNMNNEITDFSSVFHPKNCNDTIKAVHEVAGYDEKTNFFSAPSNATTLSTTLKKLGEILMNEYIKEQNVQRQKDVKDFLKLLRLEVSIGVNRIAMESTVQLRRRKTIKLPSTHDIKMFHDYLANKRKELFRQLTSCFTNDTWRDLAEVTLVSIQLFNRRRAGEIERVLIDDFRSYQSIDENVDRDLYSSLSKESKQLAQKYVRFTITGKLYRTVPVLLHSDLVKCIELLLKHRKNAGVSENNPYVFGLSSVDNSKFKYLRACKLMKKFSLQCSADFPERLRGTELRKQIATACVTMELSENEVSDVANFLGHADKVHKEIYRQPIISREIVKISKILEAAQGTDDKTDTDNEIDCSTDDSESEYGHGIENMQDDIDHNSPNKRRKTRSTSPYGRVKRTRWTDEEKRIVYSIFDKLIKEKKLPSSKETQKVINENPILGRRTSGQVRTWIHNQFKKEKLLKSRF